MFNVNLVVKSQNLGPKLHFSVLGYFWPFSVTIAFVKVKSILNQNTRIIKQIEQPEEMLYSNFHFLLLLRSVEAQRVKCTSFF